MKKFVIFGVLLFLLLNVASAVMMPGSTNVLGKDAIETYWTNQTVYFMHIGSFMCNDASLAYKDVTVYVIPHRNWTSGNSLVSSVYTINITLNSKGKLDAPIAWVGPSEGKYDVIFDTNRNGRLDLDVNCRDFIDDTGFEVKFAPNVTVNTSTTHTNTSTVNQTINTVSNHSTSTVANNSVVTQMGTTTEGGLFKFDWVSVVILLMGLLIGVAIVGITIWKMR